KSYHRGDYPESAHHQLPRGNCRSSKTKTGNAYRSSRLAKGWGARGARPPPHAGCVMNAPTRADVDSDSNDEVDRVVEIERLAALNPIDYEAARVTASARLGIRSHVLDKEVAKKRRALGLADNADEGQGRAVKIADPLPWPESIEGDRIAETLVAAIKTYAVISDEQADTIALWILQTWLIGKFTIAPRLAITSPTKGCGKTTILRLLDKLSRRAKRAGSISPPALFRAVEQFRPTILLDET